MRNLMRLSAIAVLAAMSMVVLAQPSPDFNVSWGLVAVPVSPWVNVAIGLILLAATYAFIRRHAGRGLFMLATAALVGILSFHTENMANAIDPAYHSITTPSGSEPFYCSSPSYQGYQNDTGRLLNLRVTPIAIPTVFTPSGIASPSVITPICQIGNQQLAPGGQCLMPCAS